VGPARARQLSGYGLRTIGDLLYHLPFRYEDRRSTKAIAALVEGEWVTIVAEIIRVRERWGRGGRRDRGVEMEVRDDTGVARLVWFRHVPYLRDRVRPHMRLSIYGRVEAGPRFVHPEIDPLGDDPGGEGEAACGRVLPVYGKPGELGMGLMRRLARRVVDECASALHGALPAAVTARHDLLDVADALRQLHLPADDAEVEPLNAAATAAHRTLAFDELFCLQLGLASRRSAYRRHPGIAFGAPGALPRALRAQLPFALTAAQERVASEIASDMAARLPMCRLVQGDVGSGKTVVAVLAALVAMEAGYQVALMVPTEVLAEQHAGTCVELLRPLGLRPLLLTGGRAAADRRQALAAVRGGQPALIVGTHALVQEDVVFPRLGLAIIDEQHRFGVLQRARFHEPQADGERTRPDVLVMTATPIPRTLAMTVYGDLDVSYLDELPPGRVPVATRVLREAERDAAYETVRRVVASGRQAFVVLPIIEPTEATGLRAATATAAELQAGVLAGCRVALVHGRMQSREKDAAMRRFKAGEVDVVVSTTVIEVGIDVPNATAIVVEHADRFGLAQLHQLRGRVGRGGGGGMCCLIASRTCGSAAIDRLRVLETVHDGFGIAEADLRIRGPGEFLGTRQAGLPEFRVASLLRDVHLVRAAREEADRHLAMLRAHGEAEAQRAVVEAIGRHDWADRLGLIDVG
jgi:ATP-dependent DNA helicase RecG